MRRKPTGPALVKAAYQELLSFARYFRHFGTPVIIGGWAVYFYNPYFGSVDIDVVGPSHKGAFDEIIEGYERSHGYEILQQDLLATQITASKPIRSKTGKKIGNMEIDACSYDRAGASSFHEDDSKSLPYSLCERDDCKREVKLAKECFCYVPSKMLLILFKVKARRDRSYDIKTKGATMSPSNLAWLRGKAAKDGADILAILDPEDRGGILRDKMDYAQMKELASETGILEIATATLKEVLGDKSSQSLYGRRIDRQALLKRVAQLDI